MDIKLIAGDLGIADISVVAGKPVMEDGLETAVVLSLFTERGNWWADPTFGSRLHELKREKDTADLPKRVKEVCEEALAWFVSEGVAESVVVDVSRVSSGIMQIAVTIVRPNQDASFYSYNWDAMKAA